MGRSGSGRARADDASIPRSVIEKRARRKRRKRSRSSVWNLKRPSLPEQLHDNDEAASEFRSNHKIMDALLPTGCEAYRPAQACEGRTGQVDLSKFSFLDNPEKTMNALARICEMNISKTSHKINFLDNVPLDIAPYMLLGLAGHQLDHLRLTGGTITPLVNKVLDQVGFVEHFRMTSNAPDLKMVEVLPIKLVTCRQSSISSFTDLEAPHAKATEKFTQGMEAWLNRMGLEFTDVGLQAIMGMVSEILNNAILHGADEIGGEAWVSGYMIPYKTVQGETYFACHIASTCLINKLQELNG